MPLYLSFLDVYEGLSGRLAGYPAVSVTCPECPAVIDGRSEAQARSRLQFHQHQRGDHG